jgi:signal transduction histidine kinase
VPALDLDELLAQLIDRAQDVRGAHDRLRGLLKANQSIISNLALEVVLQRIAEAACELLEARYGALGVLSPDGHGLEQFIHVGIDQHTVDRIGDLPQGKGVLGALIVENPAPIRLHDLSDDIRSVGFPAGHPPMHSFLGVPITIRGEVYGNLYLTERKHGDFTDSDVELASALAATAAVAIENARLFEEAERRQEWSQAAADVAVKMVTAPGDDALRSVAEKVHRLAHADVVTLVLPEAGSDLLSVAVAAGTNAELLEGRCYQRSDTLSDEVLETGRPVLVSGPDERPGQVVYLREVMAIGPVMVLPLAGADATRGALVVGRLTGGRQFSQTELELATTFANQAAVALELSESRQDKERMQLFEDRDRIARDLHDHVIQQLFASGLPLQGISMGMVDRSRADRIDQVVDSLDLAIQQIRNSIFELRDHTAGQGPSVRSAVLEVASGLASVLGFDPAVRFAGPVDTLVDAILGEDVVAVIREALTNVARHAGASSVEVALTASTGRIELRIADDGAGLGDSSRRSGLENLATRARRRNGSFTIGAQPDGSGTVLLWVAPLDGVRQSGEVSDNQSE